MVDYGQAFKAPFTSWKRLLLLSGMVSAIFLLPLAASGRVLFQLFNQNAFSVSPTEWALIGLSVLASVFFSLVTSGYTLRVARFASNGKNIMPPFENVIGMAGVALKYVLASLCYIVIAVIGYLLLFGFMSLPGIAFKVIGGLLMVPWFIGLMVFYAYVFPMAVVHFAHRNSFAAFFDFRTMKKYAFTTAYFLPWLVALGYSYGISIAAYLVAYMAAIASIVASLFGGPVSASGIVTAVAMVVLVYVFAFQVINVTSFNLYGQAYHGLSSAKADVKVRKG